MHTSGDRRRSGNFLADRRADYARGLSEMGDDAAAADLMRQALDLVPGWIGGWTTLGDYLARIARVPEAADAYRTALRLNAADPLGASLKLATLGSAPPGTAPAAFVRDLFDAYAERFDEHLVDRLAYAAPDRVLAALLVVAGPNPRFDRALDLGCGTGLMGQRLRPIAERLVGIDLSPNMLGKARRKGLYDDLIETDILGFDSGGTTFDLVAAADVLNYVGDLAPVFARVSAVLEPGGLFVFTLEAHDGREPYVVRPSLRFAHSGSAVERSLSASGFRMRDQRPAVLRQDRGMPVTGIVLVVSKPV